MLNDLFTQDVAGNANPDFYTNDTYRYATLNDVRVALPTANGGTAFPNRINAQQPGTVIDNNPAGEENPTYDDLLAIWDGYNGTGTGTTIANASPEGWQAAPYWSATPSASGHALVGLDGGVVFDSQDYFIGGNRYYVALEVV